MANPDLTCPRRKYVASLLMPLLFQALPALAAGNVSSEPLPLAVPSIGLSVVRVFGAFALVMAVLFGGAWLFRNFQRLTRSRGRTGKLNVLEVRSLGARHALYVVGYEQRRFLLAAAPSGISLLTGLPEATLAEVQSPEPAGPAFAELLGRLIPVGKTRE